MNASSFRYGDQWGERNSFLTARAVKRCKRQSTKVVFMPQAFGPFNTPGIQKPVREFVECADLVFPREKESYGYLTALTGERGNIRIAPDFTNLIQGELPEEFDTHRNRFCVIPNYRMVDKTEESTGSRYVNFLRECTEYLYKQGARPFILIHERGSVSGFY
ncbi:MAG: polysaccharide pyruvyl transferase family protein [Chitinivibrionales bacterium]